MLYKVENNVVNTNHAKGFSKHVVSNAHVKAVEVWEEAKKRKSSNLDVNTMVLNRIPEHRIWLETVFNVIKYLSMNGLPFRGDIENMDFTSEDFGGGIYLNTFKDLLFEVDPKLKIIAEKLPSHSKYTSADIQNQVIEALQNILKAKIADDVKNIHCHDGWQ